LQTFARNVTETNPPKQGGPSRRLARFALEVVCRVKRFLRAEVGDSSDVEWMLAIPGRPTEFKTEPLGLSAFQ